MNFYRTVIVFEDGTRFDDFYVKGSDAESYFRPDRYNENRKIKYAQFLKYEPDEENFSFKETCLGEWEPNGNLFYCDKNWETDDQNWKYNWDEVA